ERKMPDRDVALALGVVVQGGGPDGDVLVAGGVALQRGGPEGDVFVTGGETGHDRIAEPHVLVAAEAPVEEVRAGGGVVVGIDVDAAGVGKGGRRRQQADRGRAREGDRESRAPGRDTERANVDGGQTNAESALGSHVGPLSSTWAGAGGPQSRTRAGSAPVRGTGRAYPRFTCRQPPGALGDTLTDPNERSGDEV